MEILILFIILPPLVPIVICYFLNKTKIKLLKYLSPFLSLIGFIYFLLQDDRIVGGDGLTMYPISFLRFWFGLGFILSLIFCITLDVSRIILKTKKRKNKK